MRRKLQQFLVLKLNSKHIRDKNYNINITVDEARKNNEIISVGESQVIRTLFEITGRKFDRDRLSELEQIKRILKKKRRSETNKQKLLQTEKEIEEILFIPEIVNIQFSNKSHYRKIVKDGLIVNGKEYVRLLAGAGNVRTNTVVFIDKEIRDFLLEILENGRNKEIELVPAKFNAYIALSNSSTLPVSYPSFCIVKDSFISSKRKVDYIGSINDPIEEGKIIDLELNSFDGQGLISPRLSKEWANELGLDYIPASFIIRAPFVKGMVVTFDFHEFAELYGKDFITDLYGNSVDINEVDMILSESQFKMAGGYASTQEYILKSKYNNLQFGISRVSPKTDKSYVRSNYQFLQVLDLNEGQVEKLAQPTVDWFNDLVGEDPDKMLTYLLGSLTNDRIDSDMFSDLDYITQALILDRSVANDKYVRSRFLNSLTRKIYDSFLGKLIFEGNYSFLISDPYAQCEHIFDLKVEGLLKDGQHYSQFWNERGKKNVVACRPPLTYQSEVNVLNLQENKKLNHWFKYLNSGIVIPAGGIGIDVVLFADADHDGDIVATISSDEFIEGTQGGLPIAYDKSSATKRKVESNNDKMLANVDMMSFNSKIGYITNVSSSFYCMKDAFEPDDPEYVEIDKRLKRCRKFQGDAIDAGKGIKIEPFPEKFVNHQGIKKDMSEEKIKVLEFENKLVADKRPYFFKYLYSHYGRRYKRHYEKFDNYCKIKFGIGFDEILNSENRSDEQEDVVSKYYNFSYFMFYPSVMNRICWFMEFSVPEIRRRQREGHFNYFLLFNRNMATTDEDVDKMEKLYREYKSHKSSLHKNNDNKNSSFENLGQFIEYIRNEAYLISNNSRYLANLAVEVCYMNHPKASPEFAWKCFGDGLIENLVQNKRSLDEEIVKVPRKNENGNINYLWDRYKLEEYEIDELV